MNYIQISIPDLGSGPAPGTHPVRVAELTDILIARLSDLGFEGFEEEGEGHRLHAFIPEERFDPDRLGFLLGEWQLDHVRILVPETNWNEEWEKNFHPVVIDGFCAIRAFFHEPIEGVQHDLLITPKMSFGTGHHATTHMMVEAMQRLDFKGSSVLDFGTGTGILAILAEKLGAAEVLAIDCDDHCIENAMENVAGNDCRGISVVKMQTMPPNELFFIILANINKNVLLAEMGAIRQHLAPGGVILLSGLLQNDLADIEERAGQYKLTISERMTKDNWICLRLEVSDK